MTEQIREEIARIIWSDGTGDDEGFETLKPKNITFKITGQILSLKTGSLTLKELIEKYEQGELLEKAENQELPEVPEMMRDGLGYQKFIKGEPVQKIYTDAQQDMLTPKDGCVWRKVKEE